MTFTFSCFQSSLARELCIVSEQGLVWPRPWETWRSDGHYYITILICILVWLSIKQRFSSASSGFFQIALNQKGQAIFIFDEYSVQFVEVSITLVFPLSEHARKEFFWLFSSLLALIRTCSQRKFSIFFQPACLMHPAWIGQECSS